MKYDHFFTTKWYSFTNAIFTKDQYKDLNLKTAIGAGAGYQVWEIPAKNLSVELGLNYVNEDYIQAEDNDYPAVRWALNYDQLLFKEIAQFFHKHEILLGLEQVDDVSVLSQTGLRFPLVEKLNATLQVNWNWDNTPAPDAKRADTDYLVTLGYTW
jgi:putative salt-induced outer membrane protein YdiY